MDQAPAEQLKITLSELDTLLAMDECPNREEVSEMRSQILQLLATTSPTLSTRSSSTSDSSQSDADVCDQLIGHRCRVIYNVERGIKHHYAIVTDVVTPDQECPIEEMKVKVMFLYPLNVAMQSCKHFLNNSCNFGNSCKYSHGLEVRFGDLLDYSEPDFENMDEDTVCLAQSRENSLWQLASVVSISRDEGQAAVRLSQTGAVVALPFDKLLPLHRAEVSTENETDEYLPNTNLSTVFASTSGFIGDWEEHTRGIGTKLLEKMGFVRGRGLGKGNTGRAEPVQVDAYSKGKSLDQCLLKKKTVDDDPVEQLKRLRKLQRLEKRKQARQKEAEKHDVFLLLNSKLCKEEAVTRKRTTNFRDCTDRELNVKMLKLEKEIGEVEKRSTRLDHLTRRSATSDSGQQFGAQLSKQKENLQLLRDQADDIKKELTSRKEKFKSKNF